MNRNYIIGIDEAGRGAWAGPVVAGGWLVHASEMDMVLSNISGFGDSKKLTPMKREQVFHEIDRLVHMGRCHYAFAYRDAEIIDAVGIREANRQCMQDILVSLLQFLDPDDRITVYIDGCDNYVFDLGELVSYTFERKKNTTMTHSQNEPHTARMRIMYQIDGDDLIPAVSLASIVAKVERDAMMCEYGVDFPGYHLEQHKGYGTRLHQEALINYGITSLHRKTYAPVKRLISPDSSVYLA